VTAQIHAAAVLDRLRTSGAPALTVYDGKVPDTQPPPVPPYVLVRFTFITLDAGQRPDASNLRFDSRPMQVTARVYSIGSNAQAMRALTNRVAVALLDWRPSVAGRSCSPVRHIDSFPVVPDEQTGTTYFEAGDDYRFTSVPA
jgi:hypothetical protein